MSSGPSTEPGTDALADPLEPRSGPPTAAPTVAPPAPPGEPPISRDGPPAGSPKEPAKPRGRLSFLQELPVLLVVAFLLALIIKTFLVQAFYIPSESMDPTLKVGDRVLVNKLTYHFHLPRRGDIIVFEDPHPGPEVHRNPVSGFVHWLTQGLGLSTSPQKDFIKRVIGLPGDTVELRVVGQSAVVLVNGRRLDEPYLSPTRETRPFGPVTVPPGKLFAMGDNRTNSNDSRYGLGFIPEDKVVGRAFVIIWPPSRFRWLSGIHYP